MGERDVAKGAVARGGDPLAALTPAMNAGVLAGLTASRSTEALLLVLDGSGSMVGAPWAELHEAVEELARRSSRARCCMGLVVFGGTADLCASFTDDFELVAATLPAGAPGGGTGVREALTLAGSLPWPAGARRVVLMSDGMPTTGDPIPAAAHLAGLGVVIDTVACGMGADEEVLRALAETGHGRFVPCNRVGDLTRVFAALETRVRGLLP